MAAQFWDNVQDLFGNALPSAVATVTNYPAGSTASIFSDPALTSPQANPFTLSAITGSTGILNFWGANGQYKISVTASGVTEPYLRVATLVDGGGGQTMTSTLASSGGVLTIPFAGARQVIQVSLTQNITSVVLSGFPTNAWSVLLEFIQPVGAAWTVTYPTTGWFSPGGPKPVQTGNTLGSAPIIDLITLMPGVTGNIYVGSGGQNEMGGF